MSIYLDSSVIIFPWERVGPFIQINLNPFTQGYFVQSLVDIGQMVLEEKEKKMGKLYNNKKDDDDVQRTDCDQKSSLEPSAQVS